MEGLNRGIFEIWEIIIVVALLLVVSSAIIFFSNPDSMRGQLVAIETGFSTSLLKKNMILEVNYENFKDFKIIKENERLYLELNKDSKNKISINFVGETPNLISNKDSFTIIK